MRQILKGSGLAVVIVLTILSFFAFLVVPVIGIIALLICVFLFFLLLKSTKKPAIVNHTTIPNFNPTKKLGNIEFDDTNKLFLIKEPFGNHHVYNYSDITSYELIENDSVVSKGGLGRAIVGGVLAGGVGAVVGATTAKTVSVVNSIRVKIGLNNIQTPLVFVDVLNTQVKTDSGTYRISIDLAHTIMSTLDVITNKHN